MTSGRGGSGPSLSQTGEIAVLLGFIVFVVPGILELLAYLSQGTDASTQEGVKLIVDLAINWWVPLALSAPLVFVGIAVVLQLIGAGEVIEM